MQEQDSQQRALLGACELDDAVLAVQFQRSEDAELHVLLSIVSAPLGRS